MENATILYRIDFETTDHSNTEIATRVRGANPSGGVELVAYILSKVSDLGCDLIFMGT
ncbi:MAG: hypothetical protein AAFZ46_17980 [Pseudomonadota bacterium]